MEADITALVLGIGGLVATGMIGALGLYFTAKARSAPLREALYARQLTVIVDLLQLIENARLYVAIGLGEDTDYRQRAHSDLVGCMPELNRYRSLASALLPVEIFVEVSRVSDVLSAFIETLERESPDPTLQEQLAEHCMRLALLSRQLLGIDELSEVSIKLFADKKALERLSTVTIREIREATRDRPSN